MEEAEQETLYNDFTVIQSPLALSPYRFFFFFFFLSVNLLKRRREKKKKKRKKPAVSLDIQDPNTYKFQRNGYLL